MVKSPRQFEVWLRPWAEPAVPEIMPEVSGNVYLGGDGRFLELVAER
jgi:hypothetical protein